MGATEAAGAGCGAEMRRRARAEVMFCSHVLHKTSARGVMHTAWVNVNDGSLREHPDELIKQTEHTTGAEPHTRHGATCAALSRLHVKLVIMHGAP